VQGMYSHSNGVLKANDNSFVPPYPGLSGETFVCPVRKFIFSLYLQNFTVLDIGRYLQTFVP